MITPQEQYILDILKSLKPYERLEVTADKDGKPNRFLIHRSQKIMVSEIKITAVGN